MIGGGLLEGATIVTGKVPLNGVPPNPMQQKLADEAIARQDPEGQAVIRTGQAMVYGSAAAMAGVGLAGVAGTEISAVGLWTAANNPAAVAVATGAAYAAATADNVPEAIERAGAGALLGGAAASSSGAASGQQLTTKREGSPAIPRLVGFSKGEQAMLKDSLKALEKAGYDVSAMRELIRAKMPPGYRGMSLDGGAALGGEAFSSQAMLNHVLEEELLHLQQKAAGQAQTFSPGTAQELEEAADAVRKFAAPAE